MCGWGGGGGGGVAPSIALYSIYCVSCNFY